MNVVCLRVEAGVDAAVLSDVLAKLWAVLQDLKRGALDDLPGHPVPAGDLTVLLGYGVKAFEVPGPATPPPTT